MSMQPIRSWIDGYLATKRHLERLRGFVEISPDTLDAVRWPRTTGRDVIMIAATLDKALRDAPAAFGAQSIGRLWRACKADLERYASLDADNAYSENRAYWSSVLAVSVHLDAAGVSPPEAAYWDAFFLQFAHGAPALRNADDERTAKETLIDQRADYLKKRGIDDRYPRAAFPMPQIPRTTNADALSLGTYWTTRLAIVNVKYPGKLAAASKTWEACAAKIAVNTKGAPADAPYAANGQLWACIRDVAYAIDPVVVAGVLAAIAHNTDFLDDIFADPIGSLEHGAEAVAHGAGRLLGDVASGIGDAAGQAAKGFLSGFTTPLLVIGGGIAAVYLLTHSNSEPRP